MELKKVQIDSLLPKFNLEVLAGHSGLQNEIKHIDYNRPGLQLINFFKKFPEDRIQIMGNQEIYYLESLEIDDRKRALTNFVKRKPTCIIVTRKHKVADYFKVLCNTYNVPLLRTAESTYGFTQNLLKYLESELAQETGIHGVCMDIYGVGIIIKGDSGVGKSETALSLIEKGHQLIADDLVVLKKIGPSALIGSHNEINKHFLALRGVGLVNVPKIYGYGSTQDAIKVNLEIKLSNWDANKYYDAIHPEVTYVDYFGVKIKQLEIPIRPGRDIASLIEVAAKNWKLEQDGYDPLVDFNNRLNS